MRYVISIFREKGIIWGAEFDPRFQLSSCIVLAVARNSDRTTYTKFLKGGAYQNGLEFTDYTFDPIRCSFEKL